MQDEYLDAVARLDARNRHKLRLIREIVAASIDEAIVANRDQNRLRRRYLDDTLVTASRIAIAAGLAP